MTQVTVRHKQSSGGFRGECGRTPLGVLQKNSGSTNLENSEDSRQQTDYYYYQFYLAASSHEIFLRVGGREGMKGLGALQRLQLPHPLAEILDPPLKQSLGTCYTQPII